jgi:hypothetical protein
LARFGQTLTVPPRRTRSCLTNKLNVRTCCLVPAQRRALDHWQTIIAGVLALAAAFGTILVTRRIANRQIAASREEADRVIAATRAQTEATFKQTEATIRLEELRNASEALAFRAMLAAAMARVLAEVTWGRRDLRRSSLLRNRPATHFRFNSKSNSVDN